MSSCPTPAVRAAVSSAPHPHAGAGRAGAALALLSLIWGYNWIVMKQSLAYASPTDSAAWRFLIAAAALIPIVRYMGFSLLVPRREWWLAGLLGLMLAANFTGTLWGLKLGGTGKVAVLCYTMPFWTVLFARIFIHERMRTDPVGRGADRRRRTGGARGPAASRRARLEPARTGARAVRGARAWS